MYKVILDRRVAKEIKSLPNEFIPRVIHFIEELKTNPRPYGVKKLVGDIGWRIRIGRYRILYAIDDSQGIVVIYRVKHRKESYR